MDEGGIPQQLRRNCGVGLQSKRAVIALRRVRGNELAQAWAEGCRSAQNLLGETSEVVGRPREESEQVPDLRVLLTLGAELVDERFVRSGLGTLLDAREKHRFHRVHDTEAGAGADTNRLRRDNAISTRFAAGPTMK